MTALRHVLLLLQGGAGILVATAALLLGAVERSPALLAIALLSGALALVPVLAAAGLWARWRWARGLAAGYELLLLVSGVLNGLVLGNNDLVSVLFTGLLPAAILWLLRRGDDGGDPARMSSWSGAGSPVGPTGSWSARGSSTPPG